jgi:hypothetical protein
MKNDVLLGHVNRLLELVELARHAAPDDRARLERTIELSMRAVLAIAQSREIMQQPGGLAKESNADLEVRQNELLDLLMELRIMQQDIHK